VRDPDGIPEVRQAVRVGRQVENQQQSKRHIRPLVLEGLREILVFEVVA
jgi:hypothetical protein